ncbi:MAG: NUDIX domain-containing protein [Candidatus Hydrogenedentes bacterium]|nr:NUDIX domain-containing protein [Candidatus Hydrogenedentota bacterium]
MKTKLHTTAGGVVVDAVGRILTIERDVERDGRSVHEVRLPKGHIDPGETAEAAAMREVGEESGYWGVEIVADLGTAHSEFDFRGKRHVREERYFLMRLVNAENLGQRVHAGSEEALFAPHWLDPAEAEARMTYPSEREFVRRARERLA